MFEEEFQKPSVLSGVVGVALFPNISPPEIHKLRLIQHDRRIFFAHQKASANQNEDDVTLVSLVVEPCSSVVYNHSSIAGHPVSFEDINIISSASNSIDLLIHENLLIVKANFQ